jgi:hypothetical protein
LDKVGLGRAPQPDTCRPFQDFSNQFSIGDYHPDGRHLGAEIPAGLLDEIAQGDARPLRRALSALNLVTLGFGGIIGAGIFGLTGHAAAANPGPAVALRSCSARSPVRSQDCAAPNWPRVQQAPGIPQRPLLGRKINTQLGRIAPRDSEVASANTAV